MSDATIINDINQLKTIQRKKIEKNKNKKYPNERKKVLEKVFNIIGVSESKPYFRSHEIDYSEYISFEINKLEPELHQYFNIGSWAAFKSNNNVSKRAFSIIKSIFKEMNVQYSSSIEKIINNPDVKYTTLYVIKF